MQLHTLVAPGTRKRGQPYVLHTDNTYMLSERHYPPWAPLRSRRDRSERIRLEQTTFQNAAFLFPRSEWLRRSLIDDYGCDPKRVIRVGGGANFIAASLDGKQYDSQIVLFVGNDFERKGGMVLLEAWQRVRSQCPQAQLWIVGPTTSRVPQQTGVHWLGQISDRQALADVYTRASLFVLPSLFEPWGHVLLEAMGNGLACIGTDAFGMPDMIQHGKTGLLVSLGEHAPLADAMIELLSQPQRLAQMGQQAYESVLANQTWDHVVERMAPYIDSLAPESRPIGHE
jgi:glycosyltransferase involved in cell wall biosynthesis